jgi:hypothetical protein
MSVWLSLPFLGTSLPFILQISGLFSDADKYKLDFLSPDLSVDDKLILLSSVLFLDYLFFEGQQCSVV